MNFISRLQWGARKAKSVTSIGAVQGVAIHWEGPTLGLFGHDKCFHKVRGIQNFHMDSKGWSDIAYSCVVCPHGFVFEGRWKGVRTGANGTTFGNTHYYAACYLGGEGDPFTGLAQMAFNQVIAELGGGQVKPHSFFKATACPGDVIRKWIADGPDLGGDDLDATQSQQLSDIHGVIASWNANKLLETIKDNKSLLEQVKTKLDSISSGTSDPAIKTKLDQALALLGKLDRGE